MSLLSVLGPVAQLLLVASPWVDAGTQITTSVSLEVGQQLVLAIPGTHSVFTLDDPEVCDAKPMSSGRNLLLVGERVGETRLTVWNTDGREWVYTIAVHRSADGGPRSELQDRGPGVLKRSGARSRWRPAIRQRRAWKRR